MAFYDALADHGGKIALIEENGAELTYEALDALVGQFARRHCPEPMFVFLECRNTIESITAYLACLRSGCPVFLYQSQDAVLFDRLVERYDPHAIIHWPNGAVDVVKRHGGRIDMHPELRVLLSTSGSTGSPKLVKLSATNIQSNADSIVEYLQMNPSDRAITTLKFNYSYGMSVINSALACGASLLLTERAITDPEFWELAKQREITNFAGVPYTFETLARMEGRLADLPSLRFLTQAGGRLAPELITRFARMGRASGWRFYVMYGQTEASPRIAYLPPDQAEHFPGSIGRAIPGGRIDILDAEGLPIADSGVAGELLYSGPNVMMGYAASGRDLALDDGIGSLRTGDLAQWNSAGLVEIVGRASRFVKPYGLRVNLDEVEEYFKTRLPGAACTGTDDAIYIAVPSAVGDPAALADMAAELALIYKLPPSLFHILDFEEIPRLANGKTDYRAIIQAGERAAAKAAPAKATKSRLWGRKASAEIVLSRNQVITLLVSGLWHGPAWTFVSWGFLHGLMLVGQRQIGGRLKALYEHSRALTRISIPLQIAFVFAVVAFTRIFFRSPDMATAWTIIGKIAAGPYDWQGLDAKANIALCFLVIIGVTVVEGGAERGFWRRLFRRRRYLRAAAVLSVFLLTLLLGEFEGGRFVYVRF